MLELLLPYSYYDNGLGGIVLVLSTASWGKDCNYSHFTDGVNSFWRQITSTRVTARTAVTQCPWNWTLEYILLTSKLYSHPQKHIPVTEAPKEQMLRKENKSTENMDWALITLDTGLGWLPSKGQGSSHRLGAGSRVLPEPREQLTTGIRVASPGETQAPPGSGHFRLSGSSPEPERSTRVTFTGHLHASPFSINMCMYSWIYLFLVNPHFVPEEKEAEGYS